jgi:hypothetical protein
MIKYRNATNSTATVGVASGTVLAANEARKRAIIVNSGAAGVWLSFGATAVVGTGVFLAAGGGSFEIDPDELYTGLITGISAGAGNVCGVVEFY